MDNIFNFDETGLFYKMLPNRTLATGKVSGIKKNKESITIGFFVNAKGYYFDIDKLWVDFCWVT